MVLINLALVSCIQVSENKTTSSPNLLFIFTDQQSYDMIGVYGNEQVITPNLDNLAREGVYFPHAVATSPLCSPYRGMLLSGQHPLYNGCWDNDIPLLPGSHVSFAEALSQHGYETAYIGKWHLFGGPIRDTEIPPGENRQGFNGTFLTNNVTVDFRPESCFYWNDQGEKVFFKDVYDDHPWELEAQTRQAESWLQKYTKEEPFALFISWHPPHDFIGDGCPDIPGRQFNYDVSILEPSLINPYNGLNIRLRPDIPLDDELTECRKEQYRNHMAMVTACDTSVGRLINILKEKGLYDNTLIVFTSDHGDMIGSHGAQIPKSKPHDYSVRVPLIMSCQKLLPANRTSQLLIGAMDMMPTILGLLDVPVPETVQGKNLSDAIINGNDKTVDYQPIFLYGFGSDGWKGVYTEEWTYAEAANPEENIARGVVINVLFNRVEDPGQLNNLFGNEKYAEIQQKLKDKTHEWMNEYGDKGYSTQSFLEIQDISSWRNNYTKRPIDLFETTVK